MSNKLNTFYNSTWHLYLLPTKTWKPIQLNVPKIQYPSYGSLWNSFSNNPFNVDSKWIKKEDNEYQPYPTNPFSYVYNKAYSNEEDKKIPASNNTVNNLKMAFSGIAQTANALGQGRTTGNNDANYYINTVSQLGSNLPGVAGLVFSGINMGSSLVNALVGSKMNEANIKAMDSAILNRARWLFGDNSTTDALIAGSLSNVDLGAPGSDYYGKDGLLQEWLGYGTGKAHGKAWSNKRLINLANAQAHNTEDLAYKDYLNEMIRRGLLSELYAKGGPLNMLGALMTPFGNRYFGKGGWTHGSLFDNGFIEINKGGTHELNPYQGVLYGIDPQGTPNMVEEGETIFNDYVFSNRIKFPKKHKDEFKLGGNLKGKTFADVSKMLFKEFEERPNDDLSKNTAYAIGGRLADLQEEVKAKQQLEQLDPRMVMAALQQMQMAGGQQPMMAACGGKLHGCGGKLFNDGGVLFGYNPQQYEPNYYGDALNINEDINLFKTGSKVKTRRTRPVRLNTNVRLNRGKVDGKFITDVPESLTFHDDLFLNAIYDYILDAQSLILLAQQAGDYAKVDDIRNKVATEVATVQALYVNMMSNPNKVGNHVKALLWMFNDMGLNKNVADFLSKPGEKKGVYKNTSNETGQPNAYDSDNSVDSKRGIITQNRFMGFNDPRLKPLLQSMGLNVDSYQNVSNNFNKAWVDDLVDNLTAGGAYTNYLLNDESPDYLKKLQALSLRDMETLKQIKNPYYQSIEDNTPFNTGDEYIDLIDYIKYKNTPEGADKDNWWSSLTDAERDSYLNKYTPDGDLVRTGVFTQRQAYKLLNEADQANAEIEASASSGTSSNGLVDTNNKNNSLMRPKSRGNWEQLGALGVAFGDYINAMFGNENYNPGADVAYNYLSKVGNIPMVRSHPTGTKMTYRPVDLNYQLNNARNDMFGALRTINNLNQGLAAANTIAIMNNAGLQMGKIREQAVDEDIKRLQAVLSNNNQVDQFNAQSSLTAQQTNAQNATRARETQAQIAAGLVPSLGQNKTAWLNYKNAQSSGLAQLLADMAYNNQSLDARDKAFLLVNQHPEMADLLGVNWEWTNNKSKRGG